MKKILYIFLIVVFIYLSRSNVFASILEDINSICLKPDNLLSFTDTTYVYEIDNMITLRIGELDLMLGSGVLNKIESNDEFYFILTNNSTIYKVNKDNNKINKYDFLDLYISSIKSTNSFIYTCGKYLDNGFVYKYNMDFNLEKSFKINGINENIIKEICITNNAVYLAVYKDAIINDERFYNLGNINEKKSMLIKLNMDLELGEKYYFNHDYNDEEIISFIVQNDHLLVLLKCEDNIYLYDFGLDFYVHNYFLVNTSNIVTFIPSLIVDSYLLLENNNNKLIINDIYNLDIKEVFVIDKIDKFYSYSISGGSLNLFYYCDNYLYCDSIKQYEEISCNDLMFNRIYYNETCAHIKIESYFDKLNYVEDNSYIEKMIDGSYVDTTIITFSDGSIMKKYSNRIVAPYTNFIDGAIYKSGKVLEFFGNAYINGELIYFGKTLYEQGQYNIKIVDYNGEEYYYNITIDDSYYKDEIITNIKSNINVSINSVPYVTYKINDPSIAITGLIINGKISYDFSLNDDELTIYFDSSDIYGKNAFCIEKIYYESSGKEESILVNDLYTISYLKEAPVLEVNKTIDKDKVNINYLINDLNQSFEYIKVKLFSDNILKEEKIITSSTDFNFENQLGSVLKFYFVYNLSNSFIEEELACFSLDDINYSGSIKLEYSLGKINCISLDCFIPSDISNIKKISVVKSDIVSYYEQYNEYNIGKNIIIITIVFCICVVSIYFTVKLIKRIKIN